MEILKILKTLEQPSLDLIAEKMGSEFADAVSSAMTLLVSQGERIAELEDQHRWIPVTERLPDKQGRYICNYQFASCRGLAFTAILDYYAASLEPHFQHTLGNHGMEVTHWMPLPELPKEESL